MSPIARKRLPVRSRAGHAESRAVDAMLDELAPPQRPLIDALRRMIARAVPGASESVKWNAPSFALSEHFATFHLRSKAGVQLVLHLGAKRRPDVDMRTVIGPRSGVLEWKGPDRAIVTVRDATHLKEMRAELSRILKVWSLQVA